MMCQGAWPLGLQANMAPLKLPRRFFCKGRFWGFYVNSSGFSCHGHHIGCCQEQSAVLVFPGADGSHVSEKSPTHPAHTFSLDFGELSGASTSTLVLSGAKQDILADVESGRGHCDLHRRPPLSSSLRELHRGIP